MPTHPSPVLPRSPGRRFPAVLAALLSLLLAAVPHACAAVTRTVTTLEDTVNAADNVLSLREAIQFSASGDAVKFAVRGTILVGQTLSIGRDITLVGPGARSLGLRRVAANPNRFRLLDVSGASTVKISGLAFRGGYSVGGDNAVEFGTAGLGEGGAVLVDAAAHLTLVDCLLQANTAEGGRALAQKTIGGGGHGGAIVNYGTLVIQGCTFQGNVARGGTAPHYTGHAHGGAIYNSGTLSLSSSTLYGNVAVDPAERPAFALRGGGIYNNGIATAVNCTLTANTAFSSQFYSEGGGVWQYQPPQGYVTDSRFFFRNTLVAGNSARLGLDVNNPITSQGHNLVGTTDYSSGWIASDFTGTVAAPLNPQFDPAGLKNNGGLTDTIGFAEDSVARDVGDDAVLSTPFGFKTDQRGLPRRIGPRVDIGAYERDVPQSGPNYVVTTLEDADDGVPGQVQCTLREAVQAANGDTEPNTVTFRPGLLGTLTLDPALGRIPIQYPITLNGPGARLVTVSGGGATSLFLNTAAPTRISGLTLAHGLGAGGFVGGALTNRGMLTLAACTVRGSVPPVGANGFGPAVTTLAGRLDASQCTFSGNTGGGLLSLESTLTLTNCTLSGNSSLAGGGLYSGGQAGFYAPSTTILVNCTVTGNTATSAFSDGGGGIHSTAGNTLRVRNTLIAGNSSAGLGPDVMGAVASQGNNLVGKTDDSSGWLPSDKKGTAAASLNPRLGGLGNNGGPTDTRALLSGSPAVNAAADGAAPAWDQRGYRRPDTADIGAFELGGFSHDPPANVSVTPNSSISKTGVQRLFTARYADPNGAGDFKAAYFLVNSTATPGSGLYCYYDAAANKLYLRNSANTAWLGGFAPGAATVIAETNGRGRLHCAQTTVGRSGTTLTLGWSVTPEAPLAGSRNLYLSCQDVTNKTAPWEPRGAWTVSAPPENLSLTPVAQSTRAGAARTLVALYRDPNGAEDLAEASLCVNTAPKNGGGLMVRYDPTANKLYLRHSTSGAWLGGAAPGTASAISDPGGRGSLNCGASSVARSGGNLTVRFNLTPTVVMAGEKNVYLYCRDRGGLANGWEPLGTWTVAP